MTAHKYPNPVTPSELDNKHHAALRENIERLYVRIGSDYAVGNSLVLDIAPEVHAGVRPHLSDDVVLETLDLDPRSGATYLADLCRHNANVPGDRFDVVVCTEVLEHTLNPFFAVKELRRILKPGGWIFVSTPFNFRIHGPLPDCWRFTEHGLKVLFADFAIEEIRPLDTPDRPLMPIQYTLIGRKPL